MLALANILSASAEYTARFDRPYIGLIGTDRPRIFESLVIALQPFGFRLANTEFVTTGTPADYKVIMRIPERAISFQFSAEEYRFGKDGAAWQTAEQDVRVLEAAENTLLRAADAQVTSCAMTLAMHLQLLSKSRDEVLAPLIPEPLKVLLADREFRAFGCHLRFADGGDLLLDHSLAYANGIFLRLSAQFPGKPPLGDILTQVHSQEQEAFHMLGIEEVEANHG